MRDGAFNPFPGLRSFEPDEEHLFFGREHQIDEVLRRLQHARFLAVVGASGSGKSSLVRSGLIPSLYSGYMAAAGSSWRIALMRPGGDPIGNLATALAEPAVVYAGTASDDMHRPLLEATLRRSALGIVESVRYARMPPHENILVVVDQFEELFRFKQARATLDARDEAVAFVKLLVEAIHQNTSPVYVVLTMRSEFIGTCSQFAGLASAVNEGLYLVPRMTRDELRLAVTGPVAVGGGEITPRLVTRLLNDVGDEPDQLPILQHALMRTWDHWAARGGADPIDLPDYEAIGTMRRALSQHAEEAYQEGATAREREITERVFEALVEMTPEAGGVRRPRRMAELCEVAEAAHDEVALAVDRFRRSGRSFLMPPASVPLEDSTIVDLSHESLIRLWTRLVEWINEDARSADQYRRLSEVAALYARQEAALWRDPELQLALNWRDEVRPTRAWAERYAPGFDEAMAFLDESRAARDREVAERERQVQERRRARRRQLVATQVAAAVLLLFSAVAVAALIAAWNARDEAVAQRAAADEQRAAADMERRRAEEETARAQDAEENARLQGVEAQRQAEIAAGEAARAQQASVREAAAAQIAREQQLEAQRQAAIANEQRTVAEMQRANAENFARDALDERGKAEGAARNAEANAKRADEARSAATRLQRLALSRALAGDAMRQFDDRAVPALLARQAYNLAAANDGDPESPEIVSALRQSLEGLDPGAARVFIGHGDAVRAVAVSPNGAMLATAGDDGQVRLHAIGGAGTARVVMPAPGSPVRALAFDGTGRRLAAGSLDGTIRVWGVDSVSGPLRPIKTWPGHAPRAVTHLAFDRRDNLVSVGMNGRVQVWSGSALEASTSPWAAPTEKLVAAAIGSQDGRIAVVADGVVLTGSLDAGAGPPQILKGPPRVTAVAFSPDDRWIAGGTAEGRLLYWDLTAPGAPAREAPAHGAAVTALRFGGGRLASAGLDGVVQVRVADPGALDRPPLALSHGAWVWTLAFDRESELVFSAGADGEVRAWPMSARQLAADVCRRVGGRNLSSADWTLFMGDVPYAPTCPAGGEGSRP